MSSENPNGLQALLQELRDKIKNNRDRGTAFEHLIKSYLTLDPMYKSRFAKVSLWSEWEHKWGPDCGIDLVAESADGDFTAIQCKFLAPDYQIQKSDIDSFFTESGRTFPVSGKRKSFAQRILVSSSDNWSSNAEASLESQTISVQRVHVRDLEQSTIDWSKFRLDKPTQVKFREKKKLRPHQENAINDVIKGFKRNERGKLVMACGTGKTFTALRLAEEIAPRTGTVLFLVPSISLMSQTLREWTAESERDFHAFAVCSDHKVGKDNEDISRHDLAIPATTDTSTLIAGFASVATKKQLVVVFSTYQSIDVISKAQKKGLPDFDLVICDEAHRTTGVTLANEDESHFVKIHDNKFIKAKRRLYMTATPRIFGNAVKAKADEAGAELCSMDDEKVFGPEFHRLGFGQAVSQNLLTDYKVLVLAVDESSIKPSFQRKMADDNNELPLEDIAKIIGCWNGLSKKFVGDEAAVEDAKPMKRAVAFARSIKDSKQIAGFFQSVVESYVKKAQSHQTALRCELDHVDGTFNVLERNERLDWLKSDTPENTCRILSNARCLSEGVDVPALDAVLFLNSRDSQVDVVQSVGRIMRKAEGKKYGYVILPIAIPTGLPPEEALKDNKRYKVVWQVLQALRAHDDRFDAIINQMQLNKKRPPQIQVIGVGGTADEGNDSKGTDGDAKQLSLTFPEIEEWKDSIYARIVLKCGSRPYWENWASDVAKLAERHSAHIDAVLKSKDTQAKKAFDKFLISIRKNINPSISQSDAVEMLSQHLITKPVFDALFEHYPFTEKNPVSRAMQSILKVFESETFIIETAKLKPFYDSVRLRVKGIDSAEGRQRIIVELYDRFFKVAFPKMSDRLGIVYTPVEIVDFIVHSVSTVLEREFGKSISDENVHVLDPFTGTGTFIVRLLQSGIIKPKDLQRKFAQELHANEIVLLAYYIAAINIEETFHGLTSQEYKSFEGIVLTDTFQLAEQAQDSFENLLPENSSRVKRQQKTPIQVIVGNPPYSVGQRDANDNNQNVEYPILDERIRDTYAALSAATNKNSLYDSYIRSLRWATDRIVGNGIVGFVTNGSFIESSSADGIRKSIGKEFAKVYCFNLRGNARTQGEERRKEKGNVFGEGSRTPVAITIMVKDRKHKGECEIWYHDVGDYLSREEKLSAIRNSGSIAGIDWKPIKPDEHGDWINQRDPSYKEFISLGDKSGQNRETIFDFYSAGVKTNRDPWCYNYDANSLRKNMTLMIDFYNSEVERLKREQKRKPNLNVDDFANNDPTKISWNRSLKSDLAKQKSFEFDKNSVVTSLYRPFSKSYLYFNKDFNDMIYQVPKMFPTPEHDNLAIAIIGVAERKGFSALITDEVPNLHLVDTGQCFPMYFYEKVDGQISMGKSQKPDKHGFIRRDAISDFALNKFRTEYEDGTISKEDIFFYVYAVLHSEEYKRRYKSDLEKDLPRIPLLEKFWSFSKIGKQLAKLHLNYETGAKFNLKETFSGKQNSPAFKIDSTGMKFAKNNREEDRTSIVLNSAFTLSGIPLEAYEYQVNGKPAIEWVMERYRVTKDKDSGIINDPNSWSDDPRYIVDLLKRVVWLSLESNRLIGELPPIQKLGKATARKKSAAQ